MIDIIRMFLITSVKVMALFAMSCAWGSELPEHKETKSKEVSLEKKEKKEKRVSKQQSSVKNKGRKKLKPHFAGVKRPPQNAANYTPPPKTKKSSRVKNEWVNTKTHPKRPEPKNLTADEKKDKEGKGVFGEGNALIFSRKKNNTDSDR